MWYHLVQGGGTLRSHQIAHKGGLWAHSGQGGVGAMVAQNGRLMVTGTIAAIPGMADS